MVKVLSFNLQFFNRLLADALVAAHHVDEQQVQHHDLKGEIQPRHIDNHRNKAGDDACVEGQDVGILHQRQTQATEVVAELLAGSLAAKALLDGGTQALHVGRHALLVGGVATIEEQRHLAPEVASPRQVVILLAEGSRVVQFTALLSLEEIEVELTIIVGHSRLQRVAQTRGDTQGPYLPLMAGEIHTQQAVAKVQFPEHQRETDGSKPEVAAHAVQDAAHAGILLRQACQLAVGTVKGVGPGDEQHAQPVEPSQIGLAKI